MSNTSVMWFYNELGKKANALLVLQCWHFYLNAAYSQSIDNHFVTYEIFQAIECLQNLLEYNGSRDAHLNFQNGGNTSQWNNHDEPCNGY